METRKLVLFLILNLAGFSAFAQSASRQVVFNIKPLFEKAKIEYLQFEQQHGAYVQTDNVRLHYLTWGNPKDTPLIWSHGSLSHSYELEDVAKKLTDAGYYLIVVDYYGHGKTPIPDHEVSLYHSADDLRVLMDSLKIDKAIIGGFSRGGYIAAAFYQSYPDRVKGLILEDGGSVAFNSFNHRMNKDSLNKKIKAVALPAALDKLYNGIFNSEMEAYRSLYDQSAGGTQFEILAVVKQRGDKWVTYAGMMDFFSMKDEKQFSDLILKPNNVPLYGASITMVQPKIIFRNLKVPVLILDPVSDNDPMPFEKDNIALANKFPKLVTRVEFKGIEHNIHAAKPDEFTKELIRFLNRIKTIN